RWIIFCDLHFMFFILSTFDHNGTNESLGTAILFVWILGGLVLSKWAKVAYIAAAIFILFSPIARYVTPEQFRLIQFWKMYSGPGLRNVCTVRYSPPPDSNIENFSMK